MASTTTGARAALYLRISSDPSGQRAGVQRQADECAELIESRGWTVAATFEDNDRSAFSGRRREGYEQLLAAVEAGSVDAVVAWHPDRLHRSPTELERFIDLVEAHGVAVATVQGGSYDLATASGRMTARVVGAVARHESEHTSERLKAKAREIAKAGKVSGGGTRPYGYEADRKTVREAEAAEIRAAVPALLAGATLHSVLTDWRRRGLVTPAGGPWQRHPLQRMLTSARIAGLRAHLGVIAATAEWGAIISEADHRALVALGGRRTTRPPRRYLLTGGISRCGLCGGRLVARPRSDGRRSMVCPGDVMGGCGRIRILAEPLEDLIRDQVIEALATPELLQAINAAADTDTTDTAGTVAELREAERALEQLAVDHYADARIGRSEYLAARDAIAVRITELSDTLGAAATSTVLDGLDGAAADVLTEAWDAADLGWRRQLIETVIEAVIVNPAAKGRNVFDPTRVEITWRA